MAVSIKDVRCVIGALACAAVVLSACSGGSLPEGRSSASTNASPVEPAPATTDAGGVSSDDSTADASDDAPVDTSSEAVPRPPADVSVAIGTGAGRLIDRRLFGTNLPAWLGPETLSDPAFRETAAESGVTVLRMPGGSWSNAYDWSACENGTAGCFWTWAARPSDFADFLEATGIAGMWTVSINQTAEQAAAAVAFFNGDVDDDRAIGRDRNGVDWETVGTWARLRAENGHPEPVRIDLWEIGNEVYGGRPEAGGDECASFGWEDVWTCDGATYIEGDADHDGYLAIRTAMLEVDPSIGIGAVGVGDPSSWSNWGNEVIDGAIDGFEFYVVHHYGFDQSPDPEGALRQPAEIWPGLAAGLDEALPAGTPVAITEYNLVSFASGDIDRTMTRAVNALYIAETVGQMATQGVAIANQWNLANGTAEGGTDYGMIDVRDGSVFPQYHALRLWSLAGDTLLEPAGLDPSGDLRVYPTRRADGSLAVVAINLGPADVAVDLALGQGLAGSGTLTTVRTDDLAADDMIEDDPRPVDVDDGGIASLVVPPWSLNVLEVETDA